MSEFIRFMVVSNLALILTWLGYILFLNGNTFHGLNRAYLLVGSVLSLIVPLVPLDMGSAAQRVFVQLPVFEVGAGIMPSNGFALSVNLYLIMYVLGALIALWFFVKSVSSMVNLLLQSESEIVMGELVHRSENAGPFSFLSIIHLPKKLSVANLETILKHEMAHVRLGHSYDVLWLSCLRILFWFNPILVFYMRSIQEIHEYQADALTHISATKEHYVKVQLDQLFQLPSELSFANSFYNSINLKKRVNMIYSEKTSKWGTARYLVAIPLVASICLLMACTDSVPPPPPPPPVPPTSMSYQYKHAFAAMIESAEKDSEIYKKAEVMPEYPGGMQEMMKYMGVSIAYPKAAQKDGIEGKVFVQFVIDTEGKVGQVEVVKSVREDLDAEAVRVISEMPDWSPGQNEGEKVNVEMVLPISYKLE